MLIPQTGARPLPRTICALQYDAVLVGPLLSLNWPRTAVCLIAKKFRRPATAEMRDRDSRPLLATVKRYGSWGMLWSNTIWYFCWSRRDAWIIVDCMYSVASQVRTKKVCMNDERYLRNIHLHSFIFSFLHAYLLSVLIQLRIFIHHKMVAM